MNPYKDGGPRARLSFVPAYCKRCTAPPSVNDGYIARRPPRTDAPPAAHPERHARIAFDAWDCCMRQRAATGGRATACAALPRSCRPPRTLPGTCRRHTLSPRLKLSFGSAATGPL